MITQPNRLTHGQVLQPLRARPEAHTCCVTKLVKDPAINVTLRLAIARFRSRRNIIDLIRGSLDIKSEFMMEAFVLRKKYKGPGQNDLFALALAKQENCPLVTGDKQLRIAAKTENVEIKGTLWLVERMINEKIITAGRAKAAFDAMQQDQR